MKNRDKSLNLSISLIIFTKILFSTSWIIYNLPCDFRTSVLNRPYKVLHQWYCHHLLRFFDKLSFIFQERIFRTNPLVEKIVVPHTSVSLCLSSAYIFSVVRIIVPLRQVKSCIPKRIENPRIPCALFTRNAGRKNRGESFQFRVPFCSVDCHHLAILYRC